MAHRADHVKRQQRAGQKLPPALVLRKREVAQVRAQHQRIATHGMRWRAGRRRCQQVCCRYARHTDTYKCTGIQGSAQYCHVTAAKQPPDCCQAAFWDTWAFSAEAQLAMRLHKAHTCLVIVPLELEYLSCHCTRATPEI